MPISIKRAILLSLAAALLWLVGAGIAAVCNRLWPVERYWLSTTGVVHCRGCRWFERSAGRPTAEPGNARKCRLCRPDSSN